jgi:hypothetical protein
MEDTMTQSPEHLSTGFDRERDADKYQIVYLIKRPGYEFVFSVPTAQPADLSDTPALFQLRFRKSRQEHEVVLDLKELEDFYEGLSRLMEYVRIERLQSPHP